MLQLLDVTLKRGSKELFEHLDFTVHAQHRVGIVGRNGIGKSTMFLMFRGRLLPEVGDVVVPRSWTIAHLAQETEPSQLPALEWVLDGDARLRGVQKRIADVEAKGKHQQLGVLYDELAAIDGYTAEARAGEILHGLGFTGEDFGKPVAAFSGGWRIRLNLAQTLMCPSDLLLLDEPTNHLDLDATLWLERWLLRYAGTLVLISHDRDFLDRVCTDIAHIEGRKVVSYKGNYSAFERQRGENLARAQATFERQQSRRKEIEDFVNRFKAKASKAKQAQSRMRELERLTASAPAHVDAPYRFSFPNPAKMSNPLINLLDVSVGYNDVPVLRNVKVRIYPGSRIGLLGRNGAGKTTLIRAISNELPLMSGERERGTHSSIGYFAQHQVESLVADETPIRHLERLSDEAGRRETEQRMRTFLGGWGFSGDMALEPVGVRSGGEKARLALAMIAWQQPAILLLDEPTNHLDLEMRYALTVALQDYEGAIVVVSHDRAILRGVADEFWLVANGTVTPYDGSLEDYSEWLLGESRADAAAAAAANGSGLPPAVDRRAKRQDAARRRAETQPLRSELKKVDTRLAQINNELAAIHVKLGDTELYAQERAAELAEIMKKQGALKRELTGVEERWMELSEALEAAMADEDDDA
jgi:ATP-binding cassette subfamily F protein 3